jgi:hypothetical protein
MPFGNQAITVKIGLIAVWEIGVKRFLMLICGKYLYFFNRLEFVAIEHQQSQIYNRFVADEGLKFG